VLLKSIGSSYEPSDTLPSFLRVIVAAAPPWTDVGMFWATVGGVVVTATAVLVALFGPRLQDRWKQPRLALSAKELAGGLRISQASPMVLHFLLENERTRETARDVEVFVSVFYAEARARDRFICATE
jgi:hypothetical protein